MGQNKTEVEDCSRTIFKVIFVLDFPSWIKFVPNHVWACSQLEGTVSRPLQHLEPSINRFIPGSNYMKIVIQTFLTRTKPVEIGGSQDSTSSKPFCSGTHLGLNSNQSSSETDATYKTWRNRMHIGGANLIQIPTKCPVSPYLPAFLWFLNLCSQPGKKTGICEPAFWSCGEVLP